MQGAKNAGLAVISALVAACGGDGSSAGSGAEQTQPLTAATLGEQQVLDSAAYLQQAPYKNADVARGQKLAVLCLACHSLQAGGSHMIGPNLHGFFGSRAGSREGFDYSSVVKEAGFFWTPRALDGWMANPGQFLPGNKMVYAGVASATDRADIIAYLLNATEQ